MPNPKQPPKRPGLREIAALAGVSVGSVSSVLNNRHVERRIPQATAEQIRKAAAQLGYLPNISARRLRSGTGPKNNLMLAIVTSYEAPIPLIREFLVALRQEAQASKLPSTEFNFTLLIEMFSAGKLFEMPGLLTGDNFNAAIILNTVAADDAFLKRAHLPFPTVLVNRTIPDYAAVIEDYNCGTRPAEIFASIKRSRLAVLHGSPLTQSTEQRVTGFLRRTKEIVGRPALEIVATKLSENEAYEAVKKTIASGKKFDALYTVSDALAMGAYRALKEAGLKIPKDVAVIGVGDYQMSDFMDPPLSCVGVAQDAMAETSGRMLIKMLFTPNENKLITEMPIVERLTKSTGH